MFIRDFVIWLSLLNNNVNIIEIMNLYCLLIIKHPVYVANDILILERKRKIDSQFTNDTLFSKLFPSI